MDVRTRLDLLNRLLIKEAEVLELGQTAVGCDRRDPVDVVVVPAREDLGCDLVLRGR